MNRDQAKALLPIITAFAEGKEVQIKGSSRWRTDQEYSFSLPAENYRIKPEPLEYWVVLDKDGAVHGIYKSKAWALTSPALQAVYEGKCVQLREVMEE